MLVFAHSPVITDVIMDQKRGRGMVFGLPNAFLSTVSQPLCEGSRAGVCFYASLSQVGKPRHRRRWVGPRVPGSQGWDWNLQSSGYLPPPPKHTHRGGQRCPCPWPRVCGVRAFVPLSTWAVGCDRLGQRSQGDWGQEPEPSAKYSPTGGEAFGGQGRCATHREKRASGAALPRGHCFPDRITYSFPVTKAYQSFW